MSGFNNVFGKTQPNLQYKSLGVSTCTSLSKYKIYVGIL